VDRINRILVIPLILLCLMLVLTITIEDVAATTRDVGPGHTYTNIMML